MENTSNLIHCIYASAAPAGFDKGQLQKLLAMARENNAQLNVTGMLLYTNHSFFQVLEGEEGIVLSLYEKILRDPRHEKVTKLIQEPIRQRDFAQWTMGYAAITATDLSKIPGLNDFFLQGQSYWEIEQGRAKTLLDAFRQGRWRAHL